MQQSLQNIFILIEKYNNLGIRDAIGWEKYSQYSIVHHSTSIEGASLTKEETQLLLDENITAKGKPMAHHNMQLDHYNALLFVVDLASNKSHITPTLIREIAGKVMQHTGGIHNTIMGSYDSSKGDFRLQNVHAGETRFVDYTKVPGLIDEFCNQLNIKLKACLDPKEALITSFDAHFNLVSIHPFSDGNGRVSRLMMNYVQHYNNIPLCNVFKEDKADYYKALIDTRKKEDMDIFRKFMLSQYSKMLTIEIDKALNSQNSHTKPNNGFGMPMIF
jgi:Fic family protein